MYIKGWSSLSNPYIQYHCRISGLSLNMQGVAVLAIRLFLDIHFTLMKGIKPQETRGSLWGK